MSDTKRVFVCKKCQSQKVMIQTWVNPNSGSFDLPSINVLKGICYSCQDEAIIVARINSHTKGGFRVESLM